jgi:hypothetical protein
MTGPTKGVTRWRGPGALIGLGVLAVGYWGTVALLARWSAHRQDETAVPEPAPREWQLRRRFDHIPPRIVPDRPRLLEPVWSPYPRARRIGLAYGTPAPILLRYR